VFKENNMTAVIDHIAIVVDDLEEAAEWYMEACGGKVTHKEDTYYRLQLENTCIALILSSHGPNRPHIAVLVDCLEDLPKEKGQYVEHRDGTHGVYVTDPYGNHIEYICYSNEECKEKFLS
jgi:catechol-2,3-dioxygenase